MYDYLCMYVCMYACIYLSICLSVYLCIYLCIYLCMYLCMCLCMFFFTIPQVQLGWRENFTDCTHAWGVHFHRMASWAYPALAKRAALQAFRPSSFCLALSNWKELSPKVEPECLACWQGGSEGSGSMMSLEGVSCLSTAVGSKTTWEESASKALPAGADSMLCRWSSWSWSMSVFTGATVWATVMSTVIWTISSVWSFHSDSVTAASMVWVPIAALVIAETSAGAWSIEDESCDPPCKSNAWERLSWSAAKEWGAVQRCCVVST